MEPLLQPVDLGSYLARPSEAEWELLRLFRTGEPLTVFDIGACEGEDSVRYSRRFRCAKLYTFEPLPANQALIRANFVRYGIANAELIPLALSDRAGEATFHVSSGRPRDEFAGKEWNYGNKSSSLLPPVAADPMYGWIEFKEAITVRTETLANFCRDRRVDRIDFIHLDVQGAEHLVLGGAGEMLHRTTAVWLEVSTRELYRGQKLRTDIEAFMRAQGFALGFEINREIEGDQFYVNTRVPRAWSYLAASRVRRGLRHVRSLAGRLKRAVLRSMLRP